MVVMSSLNVSIECNCVHWFCWRDINWGKFKQLFLIGLRNIHIQRIFIHLPDLVLTLMFLGSHIHHCDWKWLIIFRPNYSYKIAAALTKMKRCHFVSLQTWSYPPIYCSHYCVWPWDETLHWPIFIGMLFLL